MDNKLWECPLQIERGSNTKMPDSWLGAFVTYYVGAKDYKEALQKAVSDVRSEGYIFKDIIDGQVFQIDPEQWWEEYVMKVYPELSDYFPSQRRVKEIVREGLLFHGPFMGWDRPESGEDS